MRGLVALRSVAGVTLLVRSAHIGPTLAVTTAAGLLAVSQDLPAGTGMVLVTAVFCGQLTIGWGNDLLDADRDRSVGRTDKPIAAGRLDPQPVLTGIVLAGAVCVIASSLLSWPSALTHLLLGVGAGHAHNLGVKATAWSWAPYAVAFGALPGVVTLAQSTPMPPPLWMVATGALLGVAAHFLNVVPDLADDVAQGVLGLPQRCGATASKRIATTLLLGATVISVFGPDQAGSAWTLPALGLVGALAVVALTGAGRRPFLAAVAIALVDVGLLVTAGS